MSKLQLKNIFSVMDDYDVFLFDIWGVIQENYVAYLGVVDSINAIMKQKIVFFVSNVPRDNLAIYQMLKDLGINVSPEMIITAGEIAINIIDASKINFGITNPIIFHLGNDRNNITETFHHTITTNIYEANIMLITCYREEFENLEEFDDFLRLVAKLNIINICANPDIIAPNQGKNRYCAGYFSQKLEQFGGSVIYTGKPHKEIYNNVLNKIPNISKNRILMVGDTLGTDILGANRFGIDSALVLTGNAKAFHEEYHDMDKKLLQLKIASIQENVMPNFVIQLT